MVIFNILSKKNYNVVKKHAHLGYFTEHEGLFDSQENQHRNQSQQLPVSMEREYREKLLSDPDFRASEDDVKFVEEDAEDEGARQRHGREDAEQHVQHVGLDLCSLCRMVYLVRMAVVHPTHVGLGGAPCEE